MTDAATLVRYRAIFDSAVDFAIVATDRDGRVTDWNPGAEAILGWTADEMTGQMVDPIFTPEDRENDRAGTEMRRALTDGRAADERWHMRRDGTRFWANGELMPLRDADGAHIGFLKIMRDRTAQRAEQEAHRTDAAFLRSVLAASGDCIKVLDLDARLTFMNEGGQRIMEVPDFGAIAGCPWPDFWEGSGNADAVAAVAAARAGGSGRFQGAADTFAGTPRWWDVQVTPIPGPDGRPERLLSVSRDISLSRQADSEVRRLATLVEQSTDFIALADMGGTVSFVNRAGRDMVGLAGAAASAIGDFCSVESAMTIARDVLPGLCDRGHWQGELRFRDFATDGSFPVFASLFPLRDADGAMIGYGIIARDLRAHERADRRRAALLALHDRLRTIQDPVAMAAVAGETVGTMLDIAGAGYAEMDPAGESMTVVRDWTAPGASSVAGRHVMRRYGSFIDELAAGKPVVIADVDSDPRTAGRVATFAPMGIRGLVNLPIMEADRMVAFFFVLSDAPRDWDGEELEFIRDVAERTRDAIERRRAELALAALADTLQAQVEARTRERDRTWQVSRDMLGVAGLDGVWQSVNPAWTAILGWSTDAFVGRTSEWLEHPDDHDRTRAEIAQLADGRTTLGFENRFRTVDGSYRVLSWTAVPADGLIYTVTRDVTEQRRREAMLAATEEQLRQSQKVEAVGQLTGGVAHDFNNLLTVIRGSVDLLRRPDVSEERRRRYIDAIADTADRAARLTGQLLAFARRQALKPEIFDVCDSVAAIRSMIGTLIGSRIAMVFADSECPCHINADRSQFDTALVNMAVNARDAMDGEGTLTITVSTATGMPAIRAHPHVAGDYVTISIRDTGSGIPADRIDRIFEPFFTTKGVGEGTGLGLSQVFGFAKQSGGDIVADSVEGEGSVFTLYLPRADPPTPGAAATDAAQQATIGRGARILVVEDNAEVGTFATQALAELGYRTVMVTGAAAALATLAQSNETFDVVFSDVMMPGMSGIELEREIRRFYPTLPVILTSGYSTVLAQTGTTGFELLHKPYSIDELSRVLMKVADRRAAR